MKKLVIVAVLATITGCTATRVNVTPSPISGSKADGTITMGYKEVSTSTAPTISVVDWAASDVAAQKKCEVWGYASSERFGTYQNETCQKFAQNVWTGTMECAVKMVTVSYQCID